jgi:uncharacterized protein YbaA (DUF1428 family)
MTYVDGFVLPLPKANTDAYREMASKAGHVWREHGALSYVEAIADDVPYGEITSFPRSVNQEEDETVVFAFVTYKSREHRDEVMKKVMADPRLAGGMENAPFDAKRMIYGGFKAIVEV